MVSTFPKKVEDRSAELLPGKSSRVSQTIVPSTEIVDEVYSSSELVKQEQPLSAQLPDRDFQSELSGLSGEKIKSLLEELEQSSENWPNDRADFYLAWGRENPIQAIAHARQHGGSSSSALASQSLTGWASQDQEAVSEWILAQEEGREKILFAKGLFSTMTDASSEMKSEWVGKIAESPHSKAFVKAFTREWALATPGKALDWASSLSEDSVRSSSLQAAIKTCVENDMDAAAHFFNKVGEGKVRDEAVSYFVTQVASFERDSAIEWAKTISDPSLQQEVLNGL